MTLPATQTPTQTAAPPLPAAGVQGTAGLLPVGAPVIPSGATVLTVGVGKQFSTIAAAVAAAHDGTVILVDAGTYTNDFATITSKITLIGVGGMVNMVATVPPPNEKGIILADNDATIQNFSFSGAAISSADGGNGAGIRYEGGQLVLSNDVFTDNQNGIMGSPVLNMAVNTVSIDHSVFSSNGSGSGYTHNLYIGAVASLTATNSVFEYANVGHEFKSRAVSNTISGNVFYDGPTGTASYDIDLPNGGNDTVTNNYIEKGPDAENDAMIHFGGEGIPYAGSQLTVSGNQLVDDRGSSAVAVLNQTAISASITGNAFVNFAGATIAQGPATETGNVDGNGVALPDSTLVGVLPGSTLIITDSAAHSVTLDNDLQAVEGGAGLLTAYALGGHVIAIGGSGGLDFSESASSGGNQITTAAGSVNSIQVSGEDLIDSEGTDSIAGGGGNLSGVVNGSAVIADGTGNNQWTVNGTATITGQGGNPVISAGAHANVVVNGNVGFLHVIGNGGNEAFDVMQGGSEEALSITGGALDVQVYLAETHVITAGGTQGAVLDFGAGAVQVVSNGDDTIWAGSGAATIIVASQAVVHAGTGALSLFGRGASGATFYGNGGTYELNGDTGDITYYGGNLASTLDLQLSNNRIVGGAGLLTVVGGSRETITGGSGGLVDNEAGGGANTITTAAGSSNVLMLSGGDTVTSWGNDVIAGGTSNQIMAIHGNSVVTGSTGNSSLTFWGVDTLNGVGQDSVSVQAGADLTVNAGSHTSVTETGGIVRFRVLNAAGHVQARAFVGGGSATVWNNSDGSVTVSTSAGASSKVLLGVGNVVVNSYGADLIRAGGGSDTINIDASNAQVSGGSGALRISDWDPAAGDVVTVHGGTGSLSYDQGPGKLVFIGGAGAATINGEYGSLNVTGGSGNLQITGGQQGMTFVAGSGTSAVTLTPNGGTVTFGSGSTSVQEANYGSANVLNFLAGHGGGTDVISGFRAGVDQLVFQGVTVASEQSGSGSLLAQAMPAGGTILTLSDGNPCRPVRVHRPGPQP